MCKFPESLIPNISWNSTIVGDFFLNILKVPVSNESTKPLNGVPFSPSHIFGGWWGHSPKIPKFLSQNFPCPQIPLTWDYSEESPKFAKGIWTKCWNLRSIFDFSHCLTKTFNVDWFDIFFKSIMVYFNKNQSDSSDVWVSSGS